MSLTGNFLSADEALQWGLVNHVVPHDELLATALSLAADIAGYPTEASRALLAEYNATTATTVSEGLKIEGDRFRAWRANFDPSQVESRRAAIVDRGRSQG
jgi:enoyl-CoA hydratase